MTALKIMRLRRRLKLSQMAFADLLGVSQVTISRFERSEQVPSKPVLKLLLQLESQ